MTNSLPRSAQRRLQTLAEFRYALRQFLQFSEIRAAESGLHPQQHQLLLQVAGIQDGFEATISYIAEKLGLRHHSVVELSKRCEESGLILRRHGDTDRRIVVLHLTPNGLKTIKALAADHEREISEMVPTLIRSLTKIRKYSIAAASRRDALEGIANHANRS